MMALIVLTLGPLAWLRTLNSPRPSAQLDSGRLTAVVVTKLIGPSGTICIMSANMYGLLPLYPNSSGDLTKTHMSCGMDF
jgi:hypothetical protein